MRPTAAIWARAFAAALICCAQAEARVEGEACRPYFGKLLFAASDRVVVALASSRAEVKAASSAELRSTLSGWAEARRASVGYLNGLRGDPGEPTGLEDLFASAAVDPSLLRQVYGNILGAVVNVIDEPRSRARREVDGAVEPTFLSALHLAVQFHELTGRWMQNRSVPSNFARAFALSENVFQKATETAIPSHFYPF